MSDISLESEKQLEDYLFKRMKDGFCDITESLIVDAYRQVDLGSYGIVDLVGVSKDEESRTSTITLYELKKDILKCNHFAQICRYKTAIEKIEEELATGSYGIEFEYILIGSSLDHSNDAGFLSDGLDWLSVYTFEISMERGIEFEHQSGWYRKDEKIAKSVDFMQSIGSFDG